MKSHTPWMQHFLHGNYSHVSCITTVSMYQTAVVVYWHSVVLNHSQAQSLWQCGSNSGMFRTAAVGNRGSLHDLPSSRCPLLSSLKDLNRITYRRVGTKLDYQKHYPYLGWHPGLLGREGLGTRLISIMFQHMDAVVLCM